MQHLLEDVRTCNVLASQRSFHRECDESSHGREHVDCSCFLLYYFAWTASSFDVAVIHKQLVWVILLSELSQVADHFRQMCKEGCAN